MKKLIACAAVALTSAVSFNVAAADIAAGEALAKKFNCASCHGADYNTPIDPSYPKLAGQHRDYLAVAMISYKRGADVANGRTNAIMAAQVKPLSTRDIQDIAAYFESLPGNLVQKR